MKTIEIEGWEVNVLVDEDGHLNIDVRHDDRTDVIDTGESPGAGEDEGALGFRLTTEGIEGAHSDE